MSKVQMKDGRLIVPDCVTIPYIEGDGVGAEITPVCQNIVNEAGQSRIRRQTFHRMDGSACRRKSICPNRRMAPSSHP